MFIIVDRKWEDCLNIFLVLDTRDGVKEWYSERDLNKIPVNINVVGFYRKWGRGMAIIQRNFDFVLFDNCNSSNKMLELQLVKSEGKGVYMNFHSEIKFEVAASDFDDFVLYLNSIDRYIKYDKNFTKQRLEHYWLKHCSLPKLKLALGVSTAILVDNFFDLDGIDKEGFCVFFVEIQYKGNLNSKFFNDFVKGAGVSYCTARSGCILRKSGLKKEDIGVSYKKFLRLYSNELVSLKQLDYWGIL